MTRSLLLCLAFAACAQPVEEPCVLRDSLKEQDANVFLESGTILLATNAECGAGACIRDRTVEPKAPDSVAQGYCAQPCALECPPRTHCEEIGDRSFCLRDP